MKTLYILRHAKSSWDNPGLADFNRPLNDRGRRAAPFIGEIIVEKRLHPDLVVSSPAVRARETAELVRDAARLPAAITFDERIYEASPQTLLQIVSELNETAASAMLVGHNPGLEGLIKCLTREQQQMPTAALAVVDLKIDKWKDVSLSDGNLRALIRPRQESAAPRGGSD